MTELASNYKGDSMPSVSSTKKTGNPVSSRLIQVMLLLAILSLGFTGGYWYAGQPRTTAVVQKQQPLELHRQATPDPVDLIWLSQTPKVWNSCGAHVVTDTSLPADRIALVRDGLTQLGAQLGLSFTFDHYDGLLSEYPDDWNTLYVLGERDGLSTDGAYANANSYSRDAQRGRGRILFSTAALTSQTETFNKVLVHEMGHILGLGHVENMKSIMRSPYEVGELSGHDFINFKTAAQMACALGSEN